MEMKDKSTKKKKTVSFLSLLSTGAIMLVMMIVLAGVQKNVTYQYQDRKLSLLGESAQRGSFDQDAEILVLYEEGDANGMNGKEMTDILFSQMKLPYENCEVNDFTADMLNDVDKLVLAVSHLQFLGEELTGIRRWVRDGGSIFVLFMPEYAGTFSSIFDILGIQASSGSTKKVEALHFPRPFMLGGMERDYIITDAYESSISVALEPGCEVFVESTGEYPVPVIWRYHSGKGTAVVSNLNIIEKAYRGFYSASFSLLGDSCVYPVINGSTYYIDDFPSPVPGGDGTYITQDYGMDIKTFYSQQWWNDIYNLGKKHNIRYTGLVIEDYSDQIKAPFWVQDEIQRFQYFGNMLLQEGGEIGFHGYNHMPLVLPNFNYLGLYDEYIQWPSYNDMKLAVEELNRFCKRLFPDQQFQVYVPPSNILSSEGHELLRKEFPNIKAIASIYFSGGCGYEQEFCVEDNGMIDTPRIISGYVLDDYMRMAAFSELNFHYVNTHFQHPDDVLDEERGADLGWQQLFDTIAGYCQWLDDSAPDLRNLTGTELAAAVERWDYVDVKRTELENELQLDLAGFVDEAWFFVRLNGKQPGTVTGGELTELLDGLYLMKATTDHIVLEWKDKE